MDILTVIFRLLHVVAGILRKGRVIHYFLFIEPTPKATAPKSQKFIGYLMTQKQGTQLMGLVSLLTVLGGGALYYCLFRVDWHCILTSLGIGFSLGMLVCRPYRFRARGSRVKRTFREHLQGVG